MKTICDFCNEFNEGEDPRASRIIVEQNGYVLVPTLGCFTEGYTLYVPLDHMSSFACLPENELAKVEQDLEAIVRTIESQYRSDIIVAEHGAGSGSRCGASCIEHAHLHIIPVQNKYSVLDEFFGYGGIPEILDEYPKLSALVGVPYVHLSLDMKKHMIWRDADRFPRQFVRRVCAEVAGIGEMYNWRIFPFAEKMEATVRKLRPRFDADLVPVRVRPR